MTGKDAVGESPMNGRFLKLMFLWSHWLMYIPVIRTEAFVEECKY